MKYYSLRTVSKMFGVTAQTLRNWDREGKLKPSYVKSNGYRYYSEDSILSYTQERKIRKIQIKLTNLRHSHQDKIIKDIKNINPRKIIIEDLNIKQMVKNKHLARKIGQEEFYRFRLKIKECCDKLNIILVIANRYYPSSKMCSSCGKIKKD